MELLLISEIIKPVTKHDGVFYISILSVPIIPAHFISLFELQSLVAV